MITTTIVASIAHLNDQFYGALQYKPEKFKQVQCICSLTNVY